MSQYGIVPFRFGSAAPEIIPPTLLEFYDWVVIQITGSSTQNLNQKQLETPLSLPLTLGETSQHAPYLKFQNFADPWISEVSTIIVDLLDHQYAMRPGRIDDSVGAAIVALISRYPTLEKVILLLPTVPLEDSVMYRTLKSYLSERVIIVSEAGEIKGSQVSGEFSSEFQDRYKETTPDLVTRFNQKLIRRLGHFNPNGNGCVHTIFDASLAAHELTELLYAEFANLPDPKTSSILCHSVISHWLDEPILAASARLDIKTFKIDELVQIAGNLDRDCTTLVIAIPLIETGNTLREIVEAVKQTGYSGAILTQAVLSTVGEADHYGSTEIIVRSQKIPVKYLLKVPMRREPKACIQCNLAIPITGVDEEHDFLDTYHFWKMADAWKDETVGQQPINRLPLGFLPDFKKMIATNGSWLALKLKGLIKMASNESDSLANPFLVVCPDEDGARSLALYFGLLHGFTVVRVPRDDLNAIHGLAENADCGWINGKIWAKQIRNSALGGPVVLLEEFTVSGGTKESLEKAVRMCGKTPKFHVSVAEFGDRKSVV